MFTQKPSMKLIPYAFRLKDLFLLGLSLPPGEASPCKSCVELWLARKKQEYHEVSVSLVPNYEALLKDLTQENSPHFIYEVTEKGIAKKVQTIIFSHPYCHCQVQNHFILPKSTQEFNTLLSPLESIKSARFGTEKGNIWTARATGNSFQGLDTKIESFGIGKEREEAKRNAFFNWLKKWAAKDSFQYSQPQRVGLEHSGENFQNAENFYGVAETQEQALFKAYLELAKARTFHRFTRSFKNPIMIVDVESFFREQLPSFIYKQFDMFLLFYPNSTPSWVFGLVLFSRVSPSENPIFLLQSGVNIQETIKELLSRTVEIAKPLDSYEPSVLHAIYQNRKLNQLNQWWMAWLYRSTKLSLKEVMNLESYPMDLKLWKNYFVDGQEEIRLSVVQDPKLPASLFSVVRLQAVIDSQLNANVMGMGSLSIFQKVLHS